MIAKHTPRTLPPAAMAIAATLAMLASVTVAGAAPVASKFVLSSHFGWEVNKTTGGDICTVASKNECQTGRESSEPGGFSYAEGVAVDNDPASPEYGDVYVADRGNHRVQVLKPNGQFVLMFGWEVNKTKDEVTASQAERNVCTAESKNVCQAGVRGAAAGQFGDAGPASVVVSSVNGDVYVADEVLSQNGFGERVQEFTAEGAWVLEIGKEVNETTKGNLCTQEEVDKGDKCKGPEGQPYNTPYEWSSERGAFNADRSVAVNRLAVGGPEDLLYVGDEHRVQEFNTESGAWKGEISLKSISEEPEMDVVALAVDATGDVYLAYNDLAVAGTTNVVREFDTGGVQTAEFEVPAEPNPPPEDTEIGLNIRALAVDPYGRLAIATEERFWIPSQNSSGDKLSGVLYTASGVKISEFAPPSSRLPGLAFAASDELYLSDGSTDEVQAYAPALFPESVTCSAKSVAATSVVLCGEINANGLSTRGFFDYAPVAGSRTPVLFEGESMAFEAFSATLGGLVPNETYGYEAVAEAEVGGEEVTGKGQEVLFHTATPPPEVPGVPSASDVTNAFALLSASLNPEHAPARYHFEYGPCAVLAGCAGVVETPVEESSLYGNIAAIQETGGLQPDTTYSYRLVADNEHEEAGHVSQGGETVGSEGHFTTAASPVPVAVTGSASAVGSTSAMISGTADPDGQPATYAFELGVYNGASTRFGIVLSGPAGANAGAVAESLPLAGLQPGTTYAYRIVVRSGYGESVGATATFTTEGLTAALAVPTPLQMLAVPNIAFPAEAVGGGSTKKATSKCAKGKRRSRDKCVRVRAKKQGKRVEKSVKHRR